MEPTSNESDHFISIPGIGGIAIATDTRAEKLLEIIALPVDHLRTRTLPGEGLINFVRHIEKRLIRPVQAARLRGLACRHRSVPI